MKPCPKCGEIQVTPRGISYLSSFGTCWYCDKKEWFARRLSTSEFMERENLADSYQSSIVGTET